MIEDTLREIKKVSSGLPPNRESVLVQRGVLGTRSVIVDTLSFSLLNGSDGMTEEECSGAISQAREQHRQMAEKERNLIKRLQALAAALVPERL
jgi:hypothetical protein